MWWLIGLGGYVMFSVVGAITADRYDRETARIWNGVRWR